MFNVSFLKALKPHGISRSYKLSDVVTADEKIDDQKQFETDELFVLTETIPKLIAENSLDDAQTVIESYLDKNPTSTKGQLLLAEVSKAKLDWRSSINMYYAVLFCEPVNRTLIRYVRDAEEQLLIALCEIPLLYKTWMFNPSTRPISGPYSNLSISYENNPPFRLLAPREMHPGEVVVREFPYAVAPLIPENLHLFPTCFHCLRERQFQDKGHSCPVKPHTCPFIFCSWDCLMKNVRRHQMECGMIPVVIAAAKEANLSIGFVLLVIRVLLKAGFQRQYKKRENEGFLKLFNLKSHVLDLKRSQEQLWRRICTLAKRLSKIFPPPIRLNLMDDEFIELIAILYSNSIPIVYQSSSALLRRENPSAAMGLLISETTGKFHHSCVPSCCYSYDADGFVSIRVLCKMKPGDALCINLVPDLYSPQDLRKSFTASPKVFSCGCIRCTDNTEGERYVRGQRCRKCIRGFCTPLKDKSLQMALEQQRISSKGKIKVESQFVAEPSMINLWKCSVCGIFSQAESAVARQAEETLFNVYKEAENCFSEGRMLQAKNKLQDLVEQFAPSVHPNHFVLYNTNIHLAGFLNQNPGKNIREALAYHRRAVIGAEAVLPICDENKTHLYMSLAELTFAVSILDKVCRRGSGLPSHFMLEPLYAALWNGEVTRGVNSAERLVAMHRLRTMAAALNVYTPPSTLCTRVIMMDAFLNFAKSVEENETLDAEEVKEAVAIDPARLPFMAVQKGLEMSNPYDMAILKVFESTQQLGTGLTLLGVAACQNNVQLVKRMLDNDFNFLASNEWNITPLLAMSSMPLPRLSVKEDREHDAVQALILRCLVRKASDLDWGESSTSWHSLKPTESIQNYLVNAQTISTLGSNSALHYACVRGKTQLAKQLIRSGCSWRIRNAEFATPLHLAALVGENEVIDMLLKFAAPINAQNNRGETPLMEAAYGLHPSTVKLLLDQGASVDIIASHLQFNVLHALVAGVSSTHLVEFSKGFSKDDISSSMLGGFNSRTCGKSYTQGPEFLNRELSKSVLVVQTPLVQPLSHDIYIFPEVMSCRVEKCLKIAELLLSKCQLEMFSQKSIIGFSPSELLEHLWDRFWVTRSETLQMSDLRISAFTPEMHSSVEKGWTDVLQQIHRLVFMLQPDSREKEPVLTPRLEDVVAKRKAKLPSPLKTATIPKEGAPAETKAGVPAEAKAEVSAEAKGGVSAEAKAGVSAEAKTGVSAEAKTGVSAEAKAGVSAEAKTGVSAEAKTGAPAEAKTGVPAEAKTGVPAEAKTGAPAEAKAGALAEAKAGALAEAKAGAPAEAKAGAPAEAKAGAPAEAKAGAPAEAKKGPPAEAKKGPPAEAKAGAPAEAKKGPPAEAKKGPPAEAKKGPPAEAKKGPPAEAKKGPPAEAKKGPPAEAKKGPPAEAKKGVPAETKAGVPAEAKAGAPAEAKKGPPAEAKKGPPAEAKKGPPAEAKKGPPAEAKKGPPAEAKKGPPAEAKKGPPAEAKKGPPAKTKAGAPAEAKPGAPAEAKAGAPAKTKAGSSAEAKAGASAKVNEKSPKKFKAPPPKGKGALLSTPK